MKTGSAVAATAVLLAASSVHADAPGVSGRLFDSGRFFELREAVALREDDGIRLVLSEEPFDLFRFAEDGRFDAGDVHRHRLAHAYGTVEFLLSPDGQFRRFESAGTPEQEHGRNPVGGWILQRLDDGQLDARWAYGQSALTISVPVREPALAMPGEEADAKSAPALALKAYVEARHRGDAAAMRALSQTPAETARIPADIRARSDSDIASLAPLMLHELKIDRVRIADDIAEVDYRGKALTGKTVFRAFLARIDGHWLVRQVGDPRPVATLDSDAS